MCEPITLAVIALSIVGPVELLLSRSLPLENGQKPVASEVR